MKVSLLTQSESSNKQNQKTRKVLRKKQFGRSRRQKAKIAKITAERKIVNKDKQSNQKIQDKAAQKAQKKTKKK